jgi:hypothetical protein
MPGVEDFLACAKVVPVRNTSVTNNRKDGRFVFEKFNLEEAGDD